MKVLKMTGMLRALSDVEFWSKAVSIGDSMGEVQVSQ